MEQKGDLPVHEVAPEGRKGKSRALHRNLLLPCDSLQSDLPEPAIQRTRERRRRSIPANQQEKEVHHHGSNSGDEGELPGLSPTELEMLQFSEPFAEPDNRAQEQLDGTPEESLPDDAEDLSEHDEYTPVSAECSLSEEEPSLQQAPAGSRSYSVRNRRPPNILCYDHLGNPSYHPRIILSNPATTASVSAYSPWLSTVPYTTFVVSPFWVTPYQVPVYPASVPFVSPNIYQYVPPMAV